MGSARSSQLAAHSSRPRAASPSASTERLPCHAHRAFLHVQCLTTTFLYLLHRIHSHHHVYTHRLPRYLLTVHTALCCTYIRTRRPSPPRPRSAVGRLAMRACLTLPMLACACLLWPALRADECPSPHPTLSSPLLCQGPVVPRRSVSSLHTRVHCRPVPPFARRSGAAMYASTCLACGCCSTLAAPQDAR